MLGRRDCKREHKINGSICKLTVRSGAPFSIFNSNLSYSGRSGKNDKWIIEPLSNIGETIIHIMHLPECEDKRLGISQNSEIKLLREGA